MAKYLFFTFPEHGHVNPTLAIVEALIAHGEQVVYYLDESFRHVIEPTGATFHPFPFLVGNQDQRPGNSSSDSNKLLAMLPMYLIQASRQIVPPLLESIRADQADCIVCDRMFLWSRMAAHLLHIPAVAFCPTYAMNAHFKVYAVASGAPAGFDLETAFNQALAELHTLSGLPPSDTPALSLEAEPLTLVFLPRAFQPAGETFDERFLFVGPSLRPQSDPDNALPLKQSDPQSTLYISLGTTFNDQITFYQHCFAAFGDTPWQVILSYGTRIDPAALGTIPHNILAVPSVPQLEVLARTDIFLSHGGMNSVMESLSYGVPLVVIPQILEQEVTAQRVQELGLGIALDRTTITADKLREAVTQVAHDPTFRSRAQTMQQIIQESGGYQRATDAIRQYTQAHIWSRMRRSQDN